jgi:hypothetical protein
MTMIDNLIEQLRDLIQLKEEIKKPGSRPHAGRPGKVGGSMKKGQMHGPLEKPVPQAGQSQQTSGVTVREPKMVSIRAGSGSYILGVNSQASGSQKDINKLSKKLDPDGSKYVVSYDNDGVYHLIDKAEYDAADEKESAKHRNLFNLADKPEKVRILNASGQAIDAESWGSSDSYHVGQLADKIDRWRQQYRTVQDVDDKSLYHLVKTEDYNKPSNKAQKLDKLKPGKMIVEEEHTTDDFDTDTGSAHSYHNFGKVDKANAISTFQDAFGEGGKGWTMIRANDGDLHLVKTNEITRSRKATVKAQKARWAAEDADRVKPTREPVGPAKFPGLDKVSSTEDSAASTYGTMMDYMFGVDAKEFSQFMDSKIQNAQGGEHQTAADKRAFALLDKGTELKDETEKIRSCQHIRTFWGRI